MYRHHQHPPQHQHQHQRQQHQDQQPNGVEAPSISSTYYTETATTSASRTAGTTAGTTGGISTNESSTNDNYSASLDSTTRTLSELQILCDSASDSSPSSWDAIRHWLRTHSAEDARLAAERKGDYDTTPLHLACRNCPPLDIVHMLLTASPKTVRLADSFGWLPLHYACANEASEEVLATLAEEWPESKTSVDKRRRTPLHFALGHTERPASVATVRLLSGTGAALYPDENGMLPLHYACAYGATEEALRVLTDNHIETITATDNRGRTPLHFALGNADRPASPGVVNLLLSQNPAVINSIDGEGNLPIHLLATRAQAIKYGEEAEKAKCSNCQDCLTLYLDANPEPTADLLTALQALPEWLRDLAVVSPVVQRMLNKKISQRFPTAVTLMDFAFYVLVIVFFQISVRDSLEDRYHGTEHMNRGLLAPLYVAVFYFIVREVVQALSLASLDLFDTWLQDPTNWFDMVYIILVLFWTICMQVQGLETDVFQIGAALSLLVFWVNILLFLKSIIVGFAVFVGGVVYVGKRLRAFLFALLIIMVAFAQMFYTIFRKTDDCYKGSAVPYSVYVVEPGQEVVCSAEDPNVCMREYPELCEPMNNNPWCNLWSSFYKVYTMLLGEVSEQDFGSNKMAVFFFSMFMFGVVIVLANVLIAIVTDSYSVIKNERAAVVFWSNRLDFVAEMDVISNGFSRWTGRGEEATSFDEENAFGRELWKKFMYLFDDDIDHHGVLSIEFVVYILLRICTACFIIPLWIIVGAVTFGMLWPPQVREKLLTGRLASRTGSKKEVEHRMQQIVELRRDLATFRSELYMDVNKGREEIADIKYRLDGAKMQIHAEMNNVKEIVTDLFEVFSGGM